MKTVNEIGFLSLLKFSELPLMAEAKIVTVLWFSIYGDTKDPK